MSQTLEVDSRECDGLLMGMGMGMGGRAGAIYSGDCSRGSLRLDLNLIT